jgi:hypothetical protein
VHTLEDFVMKRTLTINKPHGLAIRWIVTIASFLLIAFGTFEAANAQDVGDTPPQSGERFQFAVMVDGDVAVVGAEWHDGFKGAAHVLRRDGSRWVMVQKLSPGDLGPYDHFGRTVSIDGDRITVGAPWHDGLRGAAYVFNRVGDEWIEQQKQATPPPARPAPSDDEAAANRAVISDFLATSGFTGTGTEPPLLPAAPPPAVDTVMVTDGTLEDRVEIRWSSVRLDAIVYKVLRDGVLLSIVASDDSVYLDKTGTLGVSYEYCVVVKDMADQESAPTCDDGKRIIFAPTSVSATDGQFVDRVTISWVDMSKVEDGYYVYRDGTPIDTTGPNASWIDDPTAVPDVVYDYEVSAFVASGQQSVAVGDSGWRGVVPPPLDVAASDGQYLDRVIITWQDQASDELGYRVYRDSVLIDTTAPNVETYDDSLVVFGDTHTYCVATVGPGSIESIWVCDEGGTGLTPPGSVSASDSTYDDRITVTWEDLSLYEDGYEISRALAPDTVVLDTTRADAEQYSDFTATPDITYTYLVRAINDEGGVSAYESDEGFQSIVLAPIDVQATDGAFEDHTHITWKSPSKTAVLFKIYRDGMFIKSLSVGNSNYSDYGGTAGQAYEYTVAAVTALEVEAVSLPDAGSRDLSTPSSVAASDEQYEDRVVVSWADNSQLEHGYVVSRRDTNETAPDTVYTIGPNRTSFTDYNAVPGITYNYGVAAFDSANGPVGYSEYAEDTGNRVLAAPSNVRADDGEYEEQVEITWQDNSGAEDGYHIYRDSVLIGETTDNFTTFIDTSPTLGDTCVYSVAAYDSVLPGRTGESEWTSDTGFTTILPPVSFNASDVYGDRIELTWIDVSNVETNYEIWRNAEGSDTPILLATTGPDVTTYTDFPLNQGVAYHYCVKSLRYTTLASEEVCDDGSRYLAPGLETVGLTRKFARGDVDANPGDNYGVSVGVGGDVAIVGAQYDDNERGNNAGAAYIFACDASGNWSLKQKLTANNGAAGDRFGNSVAISGDFAIVGAITADLAGKGDPGTAYIFERDETTGNWVLAQQLSDLTPSNYEYYGTSVAISGDQAVVGAYGGYDAGWMAGAAHIYRRDTNGSWNLVQTVLASDPVPGENFGNSVAIDGDLVIVGTQKKDGNKGAAYIYRRDSNDNWNQEQKITASDGAADDYFGCRVAISGEVAIVGASGDDDGEKTNSGATYVFEYQLADTSWTQTQKLTANDHETGDRFGASVAISGGVMIVGADGDDSNTGSAYVFSMEPGTGLWNQTDKLAADDGAADDRFGASTMVAGDVAIFGAWGDDNGAGSAYVLEIPRSPVAVSASDGTLDSRVRVTWDDVSSNEHGFRVYRDGDPISSVGENVEVYEDFDAEPGRTYEYSVASFRSDLSVELERVADFGWRPPNGNITGRISTLGGGASDGIYVGLDPLPTKSLLLDGAGGHVRVADPENRFNFTIDDSYTIEAWVRYLGNGGSGSGDGALLAKSAPRGSGAKQFPFWLSNVRSAGEPGRLRFAMGDGTKTASVSSHSTGLNDNTWHHVACVHDAVQDEISLYIDGNLEGITPYTGLGDITNADSLSLGAGAKAESWFGGQLDEVRIWNVARSAADIQESMTKQLVGDENGLVAYWPLDEGSSGAITDPFAGDHYGIFEGGIYWSDYGAPIDFYVQTGATGSYVLSDLHYGNETTFKVRPFEGNRQFEPPYTMITLSVDHPVENQVNFVDISSYTLSGVVVYDTTGCPAANVSILVDGRMAGTTDKNGKFAVSADNGSHSIRPESAGHSFEPDSLTFFVDDDIDGLVFEDLTKYTLSGYVGGGCNHQIGDVTITIRGENGCLTETITADSEYSVSLPPLTYLVSATVDIATIPDGMPKADIIRFFQNLGEREVVLDSSDVTLDMTYRAPLQVTIQGLEQYIPDCGGPLTFNGQPLPDNLPVLEQGSWVGLLIEVYENYGSQGLCPLDTGTVVIYDEIADREGTPVEIEVSNGVSSYTTFACTPSLVFGRVDSEGNDRSFQKVIRATTMVEGRTPVSAEEWVIVDGHVAEEGADFITAKSNELLYILRDPPGDQSYSFVEKGFSLRERTEYEKTISSGQTGVKLFTSYGATGRFWFGFGAGYGTLFKFQNTTESEVLFGGTTYYEKGTDVVFRTNERFTTSPDERFIGEQNDVFVGVGWNFIFSVVQHVAVDDEKCEVLRYPGIGFEADSIVTTYAYTGRYIEESLIPEFDAKVEYFTTVEPDTFQVGRFTTMREDWQNILGTNDSLKITATEVEDGNRSFSGGTEYSFVYDNVETHFHNLMRTFIFDAHTDALGVGWSTPAGGFKISLPIKSHVEYLNPGFWKEQGMLDVDTTYSKSVGYVLSDDNIGDRFNLIIKRDGVYPSLVFDVQAGASSCPYEAWPDLETGEPRMMSRDKPGLSIVPVAGKQYNVPADEAAAFTLYLENLSPTGEQRRYVLREVATANPHGALIRANGVFINDDLVYFPEPGQALPLTVTVERGPTHYNYEDLAIMVYPLCEWWVWEIDGPLNLADTVFFDVTFEAPCSDITMLAPEPGWASTRDNPDVDIMLDDFELKVGEDNDLISIVAQYRRLGSGDEGPTEWMPIFSTPAPHPDSLQEVYHRWTPPATLPDGEYELRAKTQCDKGFIYSDPVPGTIDHHAPVVFGTPEPADGDLSFGEDIRVTFNEPIACASVDSISVGLSWLDGPNAGLDVPVETTCNGNGIVITPTASDTDLEGRQLRARVAGIRDRVGNAMEDSVTWVFNYRKSRFAWSELYLVRDVPYRNPGVITAELANGTGESVEFNITELPTWITGATPASGAILPGQTHSVALTLDPVLAEGLYEGRVAAETAGPDPGLAAFDLHVTVSCHDPVWTVNPSNYEHSMTMVANLMIDGAPSEDANDRLAAFVGNQLRGMANVELVPVGIDNYAAFLTVYSNRAQGETVRFQIWDDNNCKLYNATVESFPFVANGQIGSPGTPVTLTATEVLGDSVLAITIDEGWNWFSTNIRSLDMSATSVLSNLTPASGDIVKSQTAFSQFVSDTTGWAPVLLLDNVSGYMLRLSQPGTVLHTGATVPVDSVITVSQGWNWIGYLPDGPIDVTDALDDLRVQAIAQDDDIIKSQDGFAQYVNSSGAWYGSLDSMRTGEGYKLYLGAAGDHTFNYPAYVPSPSPPAAAAVAARGPKPVEGEPEWSVDPHQFQYNMTVTAVLRIDDTESNDPRDRIGAFVGDECRGVASPVYIDGIVRYLAFLLIHSNAAKGEEVRFRVFDADAGLVYDIEESLACGADAVEGTVLEPLVLNAGAVHDENAEGLPTAFALAQNVPNPFNPSTVIRYDVPGGGGGVTLRIYDVGGRLVRTLVDGFEAAGRKSVEWRGQNDRGEMVATGVYFYRMTAPGFERTRKMVLLK